MDKKNTSKKVIYYTNSTNKFHSANNFYSNPNINNENKIILKQSVPVNNLPNTIVNLKEPQPEEIIEYEENLDYAIENNALLGENYRFSDYLYKIENQMKNNQNLKNEIENLKSLSSQKKDELDYIKQVKIDLNKNLEKLTNQGKTLENQVLEKQKKYEELVQKFSDERNKYKKLEVKIKGVVDENYAMKNIVIEYENEVEMWRKRYSDIEGKVHMLNEKEKDSLNKSPKKIYGQLKKKIEQLTDENDKLFSLLDEKNVELEQLEGIKELFNEISYEYEKIKENSAQWKKKCEKIERQIKKKD